MVRAIMNPGKKKELTEPCLRPEYEQELRKIEKGKFRRVYEL